MQYSNILNILTIWSAQVKSISLFSFVFLEIKNCVKVDTQLLEICLVTNLNIHNINRYWGQFTIARLPMTLISFPPLIHWHCLLDSGCEPQLRTISSGGSDVSYKVIDTESPPYFVNTSRSLIYTTVGRTVILECRVRNLGSRAVSSGNFNLLTCLLNLNDL